MPTTTTVATEVAATETETQTSATPAATATATTPAATTTTTTTTITSLRLVVVEEKPIVWIGVNNDIHRMINGEKKNTDAFSIRYEKLLSLLQQTRNDIITGILTKFNTPNMVVLNTLLVGASISINQIYLKEGDEIKGLVIKKDVIKTSFNITKLPKIGEFTMSILMSSSKDDINLNLSELCGSSVKAAKQAANIDAALAAI